MPYSFEVTILGGSGGPTEHDCQSFMLRPYGHSKLDSICIDGGTGLGAILGLVAKNEKPEEVYVDCYHHEEFLDRSYFNEKGIAYSNGLPKSLKHKLATELANMNQWEKASLIYDGIRDYYITHPHLDHISGIFINSPLIFENKTSNKKIIHGLDFSTDALKQHIFNDTIWPSLEKLKNSKIGLETLQDSKIHPTEHFKWDIVPFKVNHGCGVQDVKNVYSTVYLLRDHQTNDCLIVCGDLENNADMGSLDKYFEKIWKYLTDNVPSNNLKGFLLECSSRTMPEGTELYGHLSPPHLVNLLKTLYSRYEKLGQKIDKMDVIITHVKHTSTTQDPRLIIMKELRYWADKENLSTINFGCATQGTTYYL